jgi:hypothetical protein
MTKSVGEKENTEIFHTESILPNKSRVTQKGNKN